MLVSVIVVVVLEYPWVHVAVNVLYMYCTVRKSVHGTVCALHTPVLQDSNTGRTVHLIKLSNALAQGEV